MGIGRSDNYVGVAWGLNKEKVRSSKYLYAV